jgi:hypothetical protein
MTRPRQDYDDYRDRQAAHSRSRSQSGREIGPLPDIVDRPRRERAAGSLRVFCETYLAEQFRLAWSADHLRVIDRLERCAREGGQFALAMPRGSGKTTLTIAAALWTVLYGYRRYVVLLGATSPKGSQLLRSVRDQLEMNERLAEDFPEACYPIVRLERIYNRANGQTLDDQPTRMEWTKYGIRLPTVPGSACSGSVLEAYGITGAFRGAFKDTADGRKIRPDFVIGDDPQTKRSAKSQVQCDDREQLLKRDAVGLGGPGVRVAVIVPCTVIRHDDLADRLLDRKLNPEWQGEKTRLLKSFPKNLERWEEYGRLRSEDLQAGGDGAIATEYYREHQEEMDAGAEPAWPARFNDNELSAVQNCMNLWLKDPEGFAAEYQNEPKDTSVAAGAERLTVEVLVVKVLPMLRRGTAPGDATRVTGFIDVQKRLLYWMVCGWDARFGGAVLDYGTWPEQPVGEFTALNARATLKKAYPKAQGVSGLIYSGLHELITRLVSREWPRETEGLGLRLSRLLVDCNWSESTEAIFKIAREHPHAALICPSRGRGISEKVAPISAWKPSGLRRGRDWQEENEGTGRVINFDTNSWKSFAAGRLQTPPGSHGSLGVWGHGLPGRGHTVLFDHLTSEYSTLKEGPHRKVDVWQLLPNRENHWWDCLVGSAVAASIDGLIWSPAAAAGMTEVAPAQPVKFSELVAAKRRARLRA